MLIRLCFLLAALALCTVASPQPCGKRDTLCWQLQLPDDQCSSSAAHPCYNIYALNQSNGQLNWYAYTTSSSGIKDMSVVSGSNIVGLPGPSATTAGKGQQQQQQQHVLLSSLE
jgi:hypothetical protein